MCLLEGLKAKTFLCYQDEEILDFTEKSKPELVTIDAPLHLPPGRKTIDDRNGQHYRPCDLELRKRKIPFFPITLGPMRKLTERGIQLKDMLEKKGYRVVEMYPGGAQDIWGIPRAKHDLVKLKEGLGQLGLKGLKKDVCDHELDAATGALVGRLFLQDKAEVLGDFSTGAIIIPCPGI
jgi:predicted nuclease with RNAse H fold